MSEIKVVDARNTFCPGPLMELISFMKRAEVGDEMELLSTDDGSANDVPQWIAKVGHELVSNEKIDDVWHIVVKKLK
ncbi:MAG: sulfurtransferase TusA family protein [Pseudomonadota bacterium]|nr:sulfurtransferase TusA family protein [Pseudomonadota bacterium]